MVRGDGLFLYEGNLDRVDVYKHERDGTFCA